MNQPDPISLQMDVIARLLETAGYAIDVDYPGASIIVWCENWPIVVAIKQPRKEDSNDSICDRTRRNDQT